MVVDSSASSSRPLVNNVGFALLRSINVVGSVMMMICVGSCQKWSGDLL